MEPELNSPVIAQMTGSQKTLVGTPSLDIPAAPGPTTSTPQNANAVLGRPDYDDDNNDRAVSLGGGGILIIEFVDNVLTGSDDEQPDLAVFEVDPELEPFAVYVSRDGISWEDVGTGAGGTVAIDLDAFGFTRADRFRFVRVVDDFSDDPGTLATAGADIDAIGAVTSVPREGGVTATFEEPVEPNKVVSGVGTPAFTWGEPSGTPFPNSLRFQPGSYAGDIETEFDLGTITYVNGTTKAASTPRSVSVKIVLETDGENRLTPFVFKLELQSTSNDGGPLENADIVRFPNPYSDTQIEIGGLLYRLRLRFESASVGGISEIDRLLVYEGDMATVVLRGNLTRESPLEGCLPRRLTFDHSDETFPAWNPNGESIAFATSQRNSGFVNIGGIQANRSDERRLGTSTLATPGLVSGILSWRSPKHLLTTEAAGIHEVLEFDTSLAPFEHEFFDENDKAFTRVLAFSSHFGGFFVVSADGGTALWHDRNGNTSTLRVAHYPTLFGQSASTAGTVRREWTSNQSIDSMHYAALAPDGSFFILSERPQLLTGYDLLLFATGGNAEPVEVTTSGRDSGALNQFPAISPDGLHVAYSTTLRNGSGELSESDIYLTNIRTSKTRNITDTPEIPETHPSWAPDGGSLVYSRFDGVDSPELRTGELLNWNLYTQCIEELNDRDGDGIVDLLEEAFGSDPNSPGQPKLPVPVVINIDGVMRFGLQFNVALGGSPKSSSGWSAGGFEYFVLASTDLKQWILNTEDAITIQSEPISSPSGMGKERLTALFVESIGEQRSRFMRVAVSRISPP